MNLVLIIDFVLCFVLLQEVPDENYDLPYNQTETNGDAVMIKMDVPNREEPSFPKEKWKSLIGKLSNQTPIYFVSRKRDRYQLYMSFKIRLFF